MKFYRLNKIIENLQYSQFKFEFFSQDLNPMNLTIFSIEAKLLDSDKKVTIVFANCFEQLFLFLHFGFEIIWQKNIDEKAACKTMMKLTKVVNFINILLKNFLYKCCFSSFSLVTCT